MTKVIQKNIRCIKCGQESPQLIIYSESFETGDKDNDNYLDDIQACPHCGYNATSISVSDEIITHEQKEQLAKYKYGKLDLKDYELSFGRDEEIMADYVSVPNLRGPGGLIIGDDGSYLFCQSAYSYEYYKEKYKNGERSI